MDVIVFFLCLVFIILLICSFFFAYSNENCNIYLRIFYAFIACFCVVLAPFLFVTGSFSAIPEHRYYWGNPWLDSLAFTKLILAPCAFIACVAMEEICRDCSVKGQAESTIKALWLGGIFYLFYFISSFLGEKSDIWYIFFREYWHVALFSFAFIYMFFAIWGIVVNKIKIWNLIKITIYSSPLYILAFVVSKIHNDSLPVFVPRYPASNCFVVTAAMKGYPEIVGPFCEIEHSGKRRYANEQLIVFWSFERSWKKNFPFSHKVFRKIYNLSGPIIAKKLQSRFSATCVYILLKPCEFIARLIIRKSVFKD